MLRPSRAPRWNGYGIGLLEQAQYGPAPEAFRKASELEPSNPDFLAGAALAELRTERFGAELLQLAKASALVASALRLSPTLPRARFYHALAELAEVRRQTRFGHALDRLRSRARAPAAVRLFRLARRGRLPNRRGRRPSVTGRRDV